MRISGWPGVLTARVEEWRHRPFAWGAADCCAFVADVTAAISGENRRSLFPAYATEAEANALLHEHGGMAGLLTRSFGPSKHPSRAMRGDVVMIDVGNGPTACICLGAVSCAMGVGGLVFVPTAAASAAWNV